MPFLDWAIEQLEQSLQAPEQAAAAIAGFSLRGSVAGAIASAERTLRVEELSLVLSRTLRVGTKSPEMLLGGLSKGCCPKLRTLRPLHLWSGLPTPDGANDLVRVLRSLSREAYEG